MEATVLYGARDVRFEDRPEPDHPRANRRRHSPAVHVHLRVGPVAVPRHSTGVITGGDGPRVPAGSSRRWDATSRRSSLASS